MKRTLIILIMVASISCIAQKYPYKTLAEAFKAAKFNPKDKNSSFFIATADPHCGIGAEGFPEVIINEVNAMKPHPSFLVVNGDMITSASRSFGNVPDTKQKEKALQEFRKFKQSMEKLDPEIPYKFTLGNHDTYPYEKDGKLFRKVFTDHNVYDSFDQGNIHFILLNGAQSGDIDKKQAKWFNNDVSKIPVDKTVIIFVHQPAIGSVVNERGIAKTISKVFIKHKGNIWLIGGHAHCNRVKVYKLPQTNIVQVTITTCNPEIWGSEKPGYWIYCLQNGNVFARIFRRLNQGFRIDKKPAYSKAKPIPVPFEKTENRLWTLMVGEGDRKYLVKAKGGDVVTWWAYVKELIYKFPLCKTDNQATKLALLAYLGKLNIENENQVFFSIDGKEWQQQKFSKPENGVYLLTIPKNMRTASDLYVKIIGRNHSCVVGGFALCE